MMLLTITLLGAGCSFFLSADEREMRHLADQIEETDERTVTNCRYLGTVAGKVDPRTVPERHAIKTGRKLTRRHAAEIGATHIVWLYSHQSASAALAYDCTPE